MKRGDLDQPRTGAPGDLDQPGSGGSEPAIAGDDALDDAAAGPRDHDHMQQAVDAAAAIAEETGGLGRLGRPMNRRSPFFIGMAAAAGVAVTYGLVELLIRARSVLVLIGLALFIAAGLDPAVKLADPPPPAPLGGRDRDPAHRGRGRGRVRGRGRPAAHRPGHRPGPRAAALRAPRCRTTTPSSAS